MPVIKPKYLTFLRRLVLAGILIGVTGVYYLHTNQGTSYPSVHAICPFGGLENLWVWFAGRSNIQKIFSGTMTLFFLLTGFALLLGRSFCGNICPFGALQEFIGLFNPKKIKIPKRLDSPLRYLKYVILVISLFMAWTTATLWISPYDPWAAFAHVFTGEDLFNEYAVGTLILIFTVVASVFISRFFCKYLCPAGAFLGIIAKVSPFKVERNPITCINCGKCNASCPMDIDIQSGSKVTSAECIHCAICVNECPQPGKMIDFKFVKISFKAATVIAGSIGIFFGSLFLLDSAKLYRVSLPPVEEVVEQQNYIAIADLRGSMSIELGAYYTGMELDEFYELMEIPKGVPKDTLLKYVSEYVSGYDFHVMKATKVKRK